MEVSVRHAVIAEFQLYARVPDLHGEKLFHRTGTRFVASPGLQHGRSQHPKLSARSNADSSEDGFSEENSV